MDHWEKTLVFEWATALWNCKRWALVRWFSRHFTQNSTRSPGLQISTVETVYHALPFSFLSPWKAFSLDSLAMKYTHPNSLIPFSVESLFARFLGYEIHAQRCALLHNYTLHCHPSGFLSSFLPCRAPSHPLFPPPQHAHMRLLNLKMAFDFPESPLAAGTTPWTPRAMKTLVTFPRLIAYFGAVCEGDKLPEFQKWTELKRLCKLCPSQTRNDVIRLTCPEGCSGS